MIDIEASIASLKTPMDLRCPSEEWRDVATAALRQLMGIHMVQLEILRELRGIHAEATGGDES